MAIEKGKDLMIAPQLECYHYRSPLDVVAIKFKCCQKYYGCCFCHDEIAGHRIEKWEYKDFGEKAVLCKRCGLEFTIFQYLKSNSVCVYCNSGFNPKCKRHWHIYFKEPSLALFQVELDNSDQKSLKKGACER